MMLHGLHKCWWMVINGRSGRQQFGQRLVGCGRRVEKMDWAMDFHLEQRFCIVLIMLASRGHIKDCLPFLAKEVL